MLGEPLGRLVKVRAQMCDQLGVARVIDGFDSDDPRLQRALVLLHVLEEVQLGLRRTDDENLVLALERVRHLVKEAMLVVRVIPHPQVLFLGMPMNVRAWRVNDGLTDLVGVDVEDASFLLIEPYDRVLHDDLLW
jgi:hypothetical protein